MHFKNRRCCFFIYIFCIYSFSLTGFKSQAFSNQEDKTENCLVDDILKKDFIDTYFKNSYLQKSEHGKKLISIFFNMQKKITDKPNRAFYFSRLHEKPSKDFIEHDILTRAENMQAMQYVAESKKMITLSLEYYDYAALKEKMSDQKENYFSKDLEEKNALLCKRNLPLNVHTYTESMCHMPYTYECDFCQPQRLSYEDLFAALSTLAHAFENHFYSNTTPIQPPLYHLFFNPGKSSEWISTLMLRTLHKDFMPSSSGFSLYYTPKESFSIIEKKYKQQITKCFNTDSTISHYMILDDAHYSGDQITTTLRVEIRSILEKNPDTTIWIIAPFMSTTAKYKMIAFFLHSSIMDLVATHLHVNILTSSSLMKSPKAVLEDNKQQFIISETSNNKMTQKLINRVQDHDDSLFNGRYYFYVPAARPEWKDPDHASLDQGFLEGSKKTLPLYKHHEWNIIYDFSHHNLWPFRKDTLNKNRFKIKNGQWIQLIPTIYLKTKWISAQQAEVVFKLYDQNTQELLNQHGLTFHPASGSIEGNAYAEKFTRLTLKILPENKKINYPLIPITIEINPTIKPTAFGSQITFALEKGINHTLKWLSSFYSHLKKNRFFKKLP